MQEIGTTPYPGAGVWRSAFGVWWSHQLTGGHQLTGQQAYRQNLLPECVSVYLGNFSFQSKNEEFQLWRCHQKLLDLVYPLNLLNLVLNICFNEIGLKLKKA